MDFALTDQQQMFRDSVAAFARKELGDGALERAHTPHFPHDVAKKMAEARLLGITLPESDGGGGGTLMDAGMRSKRSRVTARAVPTYSGRKLRRDSGACALRKRRPGRLAGIRLRSRVAEFHG